VEARGGVVLDVMPISPYIAIAAVERWVPFAVCPRKSGRDAGLACQHCCSAQRSPDPKGNSLSSSELRHPPRLARLVLVAASKRGHS
jgi:hypothetical protein